MIIAFYSENRIVQYPGISYYTRLQDKATFMYSMDTDTWYRYVPPFGPNTDNWSYYETTQLDLIPDTYKTYVLLLKG